MALGAAKSQRGTHGAVGQKVDPPCAGCHQLRMPNSPPRPSKLQVMTVGLVKARADAGARRHAKAQRGWWAQRKTPLGAAGAALLVAMAVAQSGCATEEVPADAMTHILRATIEKDGDALWNRLTPSSQQLLERISAEDAIARGTAAKPAKAQLLSGGLDLAVGVVDYKEVARNGDDALLVATDHKGKQREIHVRRIDGQWRLQLKAARKANAVDPFADARRAHAQAKDTHG